MTSIALRHKQKCLEAHATKQAGEVEQETAPQTATAVQSSSPVSSAKSKHQQEVALTELQNDLERLSDLEDVADKVALKKNELLPKYLPIVQAYRDSGADYPNELLVRVVIWLIDAEDIETAVELAGFAIAQQQHMPGNFKRDLPTYVVEEITAWSERQYKAKASASPYLDDVAKLVMADFWIVNQPIVLNKLYKLLGLYAECDNQEEQALAWFEKCEEVNPDKSGVKTKIKVLKAKLNQ